MSEYGAGKFADASKNLELAVTADPENSELHNVLAQSCLAAKKFDCALGEFKWILKRNPDSASAHMLSGEALDGLGRTTEAIEEFTLASKSDPKALNVNFGLGYLYWKLREYDDAGRAFEVELANDPSNPQALAYLGDVEMKRGNTDKALSLLQNAVRLRNDIRIAYVDIGVILTQQKHYQEALDALQRGEKLDPEQPEVHYRLGRLYQAMGNTVAAQREFTMVQNLHQKAEDDIADKMSGRTPVAIVPEPPKEPQQ
jgi:tetratricopeptide (TPR) repeat protein